MGDLTRRPATAPGEAALRAYLLEGSIKEAAKALGLSEVSVRSRLARYYRRVGVANAAQAAYLLDRPGGLTPAPIVD